MNMYTTELIYALLIDFYMYYTVYIDLQQVWDVIF